MFGLDLSLNSIVIPIFIVLVAFTSYLLFIMTSYAFIPGFWQLLLENIFFFVLNIIEEQIGRKGYVYLPLLLSLFVFILLSNLLSMTPFSVAITSHIALIFLMSLSIGISSVILGLYLHGTSFFKLFIPECPLALLPFLILIELFSFVIKFISLAIRLSANIMAGHTLVHIIALFVVTIFALSYWLVLLFGPLLLAILLLEVGVAFLQAYVFVVLVCIYLSDSLNLPSH
jgi:ATP synthase subunit 6